MMRKRVAALETKAGAYDLPASVRAWLGQPITQAERVQVDADEIGPVDWSALSREDREWLQG